MGPGQTTGHRSPVSDGPTPPGRPFERRRGTPRRWRRRAVNALIVAWVVALAVWNAPDSPLRRRALPPVRTAVLAAGLEQNWGVFAPDPRKTSRAVEAQLTWSDGTTSRWRPPVGGWFDAWRDYRWQKVGETVAVADRPRLEAMASWIAGRQRRPGATVVSVRLSLRTSLDPGVSGDGRGSWIERDLLIWRPA